MKTTPYILALLVLLTTTALQAQTCSETAANCENCYTEDYIGDGQEYRALVSDDEEAEFTATFFGGNTYRVAACTGQGEEALLFKILDEEGNVLFDNRDHANAKFWDFVVGSTMTCTVEAQLDPEMSDSGCAVILIGFKQ